MEHLKMIFRCKNPNEKHSQHFKTFSGIKKKAPIPSTPHRHNYTCKSPTGDESV